jgi:hypothetical protein
MMFDDELRRAFDTLTERLRGEIDRQAQAAMDELAASARTERDRAVAAERAEIEAALASERAEHAARLASERAGREAALASERAEHEAVVASHHAEHAAALASARAERDAALAAVTAAPPVVQRSDGDELIRRVVAGIRALAQASSLTGVLEALLTSATSHGGAASVWLVRGPRLELWRSHDEGHLPPIALDAAHPAAEAARTRTTAHAPETVACPLTLSGETVAVLLVQRLVPGTADADIFDVLTLYASRSLEAITAFKTVRAVTSQTAQASADEAAPVPAAAYADDEERASAHRYAKLLVSEIRLYHEADVVEGRRVRDLGTRLGGEIARARVMYEQRVPPHVREQVDYFHEELVRTLANGDAALLDVKSEK